MGLPRPRAVLDLVRAPLTPTAVADSLAGHVLAWSAAAGGDGAAGSIRPERLSLVCAVSVLTYWMGMATNDVVDLAKDRERAPHRPLPSGALNVRQALALSAALFAVALGVAAALGVAVVFLTLAAAVLAYNGGAKRIPVLGSLLMGACRSLNLLLGAAALEGTSPATLLGQPSLLAAAAVLGVYIAGVTSISVLEDRPYRRRLLAALVGLLALFPVALAVLGWRHPGAWVNCVLFAAFLAPALRLPPDDAALAAGRHPAEGVVRRGLGALYFVDAGLLWRHGLAGAALAEYFLFALGWLWMRWWVQSGRSF